MAKTKPIGVRFDEELLNTVKDASLANSPQKALNLYERSYLELVAMKVAQNNKHENRARIEAERNPPIETGSLEAGIQKEIETLERGLDGYGQSSIGKQARKSDENKIRELKKLLK